MNDTTSFDCSLCNISLYSAAVRWYDGLPYCKHCRQKAVTIVAQHELQREAEQLAGEQYDGD